MNIGRVIEYSQVTDQNRARKVAIQQSGKYTLSHSTQGYECAGSAARWTDEFWSVTFYMDNALHGRRFTSEQAARDLFAVWTKAA